MSTATAIPNAGQVISVTEPAAGEIRHLLAEKPEHAGKHLRVYVERGGCSGMQYGLVFDEQRPDDFRGDSKSQTRMPARVAVAASLSRPDGVRTSPAEKRRFV
jgi:Fe-S cluster assembly iron-binding protein IscA